MKKETHRKITSQRQQKPGDSRFQFGLIAAVLSANAKQRSDRCGEHADKQEKSGETGFGSDFEIQTMSLPVACQRTEPAKLSVFAGKRARQIGTDSKDRVIDSHSDRCQHFGGTTKNRSVRFFGASRGFEESKCRRNCCQSSPVLRNDQQKQQATKEDDRYLPPGNKSQGEPQQQHQHECNRTAARKCQTAAHGRQRRSCQSQQPQAVCLFGKCPREREGNQHQHHLSIAVLFADGSTQATLLFDRASGGDVKSIVLSYLAKAAHVCME